MILTVSLTVKIPGMPAGTTLVMPCFLSFAGRLTRAWKILATLALFSLGAAFAQVTKPALGIAWSVQGNWLVQGSSAALHSGDAIQPHALLQPGNDSGNHSITILLPDGQRVLYECFTPADCARGFRVPALTATPDAFSINLLARIRSAVAAQRERASSQTHAPNQIHPPARDEAVAVLNSKNQVHVAGLLAELPNGRYTCDLRPLDPATPPQHQLVLEKSRASVQIQLPAPGLYTLIVSDAQNNPRVDLFLAAIRPTQSAPFQSFHRAKDRMEDWNDNYAGWPIDDFLRAYLASLIETPPPARAARVQ
jgi:hypothetical protein